MVRAPTLQKMEQFSSILIDRMQLHPSKDEKIVKSRNRSFRTSPERQLCSLPLEETGEVGGRLELVNRLEMSNLQLFLWKSQGVKEAYPSVFQLIRLPQMDAAQVTLNHLLQRSFPVLSFKVKELVNFACMILQSNSFARGVSHLNGLFSAIADNYNCVSYHNFSHAFNLMLLNFQCMERQPTLKNIFSDQEWFCIAVAALAHDLGHSGTNNHFQVQRRSELARISNNVAVLEHMHVRTLWRILQERPQINFLSLVQDQTSAKKAITGLILNTDMGSHHAGINKLRAMHNTPLVEHKWTLMEQLFHACDIGNSCLDYDIYMGWSAMLAFEFDAQTHLQQKLGLEVSRGLAFKGISSLYSDQECFLESIVQPLWKEISFLLPNLESQRANVETNLKRIKEQIRNCCQE